MATDSGPDGDDMTSGVRDSTPADGPRRPGPGSLIVLGIVVACILGMGALALKDWYPLISSPAFWNPSAPEGK